MDGAIQASRPRFNQKTISGLKTTKTAKKRDYEELMEEGSNRKPKQLAFRGEMSPASEISPPSQCDIYKVAKIGHRNWSHSHCDRSDTKLSVFTTTRAVLTELYTQVPSLSRTHTHTHTHQTYYMHSLNVLHFCSLAV